jgi:hypothetical protein
MTVSGYSCPDSHFLFLIFSNTLGYSHVMIGAHQNTSVHLTRDTHLFLQSTLLMTLSMFHLSLIFHHCAEFIPEVTSVLSATSNELEPLLTERDYHISCDMYFIWPNRNTFSCYVMMWLIGFIFLWTGLLLMVCVCNASVAFKHYERFTGSLCLMLPWRMLFCLNWQILVTKDFTNVAWTWIRVVLSGILNYCGKECSVLCCTVCWQFSGF